MQTPGAHMVVGGWLGTLAMKIARHTYRRSVKALGGEHRRGLPLEEGTAGDHAL